MRSKEPGLAWRIAEAIFFEQWLRFYFIEEKGDLLLLHVPQEARLDIRTHHPHLYPILEGLEGHTIDHQAVIAVIGAVISGTAESAKAMPQIKDAQPGADAATLLMNPDFQQELSIFGTWLQGNALQLDKSRLSFTQWVEEFSAWRQSGSVDDYMSRLKACAAQISGSSPETMQ